MKLRALIENYNPAFSLIQKPFIIAEAGVNHEGSMELAKRLIDEAKEGGADAIKFQTYKAEKIASRSGLIPCGGLIDPFYSKDVLLLGDAAGMVSPLTAGGIHPAINIGTHAGELIAEHLLYQGENPGPALKHEIPRYVFKRGLRSL